MSPLDCYIEYVALKAYFNTKYDYKKFQNTKFKVKVTQENFDKRKDRSMFFSLANKHNPFELILSNVINNPDVYVQDILTDDGVYVYNTWIKNKESQYYYFCEDLKTLNPSDFKCNDGQHPNILKLFMRKRIRFNTFCILFDICHFDQWQISETTIWPRIKNIVSKSRLFIKYDHKYKCALLAHLQSFKPN